MANVVKYNTRVTMKSDLETNWNKATGFIPLKGEIIHYSDLNKIKIGDGTTTVGALKFIAENEINALDADIQDAIDELRESTESSISAINTRYDNTISPAITKANNAVLYTAQTLTDAQKEQARKNIGLFSSSDSNTVVDIKVKEATKADEATNATNAVNAKEAEHAETADSASQAGHASNADEAAHAETATNATNDASGNPIKETYATKAELTAHVNTAASSTTLGHIKIGYTENGKNYPVELDDNKAFVNVPWTDTNTKVTSVDNHYTPAENTSSALSADASSSIAATWGTTALVTGVNLQRDAKGHVTGVTVDSIKMPSNPDTDTNQTIKGNNVTFGENAIVNIVGGGATTVEGDAENNTITISSIDNNTTYTLNEGTSEGYIKLTPSSGSPSEVKVKGIDTAAYKADTYFATAAGLKATNDKLETFLGSNEETLTQVLALIEAAEESEEIAPVIAAQHKHEVGTGLTVTKTYGANGVVTYAHADTSTLSGAYGPSEGGTQSPKDTLNIVVPQITVDEMGHVTAVSNKTFVVTDTDTHPTLPTVNNGKLTIQKNGAEVGTFYANQSTPTTANLTFGAAADKNVDTSISAASTSTNLPTSEAVAAFVEGKGYKTTDNDTTYTFATGSSDGTFTVTPKGGSAQSVSIKGLGSLAYKSSLSSSDVTSALGHTPLTREEIVTLIQEAIEPYAILYAGTSNPASSIGVDGDVYIQY